MILKTSKRAYEVMFLICKGGFTQKDLHDTICMTLFSFKISSYKSEEVDLILSFKNHIMQILMQKVVTIFQFTCSD